MEASEGTEQKDTFVYAKGLPFNWSRESTYAQLCPFSTYNPGFGHWTNIYRGYTVFSALGLYDSSQGQGTQGSGGR